MTITLVVRMKRFLNNARMPPLKPKEKPKMLMTDNLEKRGSYTFTHGTPHDTLVNIYEREMSRAKQEETIVKTPATSKRVSSFK